MNLVVIGAEHDAFAVHSVSPRRSAVPIPTSHAGADLIFVEAPQTIDEISSIPAEVGGPVMFNIVENGSSPPVELEQLAAWGYRLAIRPLAIITPVVSAALRALAEMDPPTPLNTQISTPGDLFESVNLSAWLEVGNRFGSSPVDREAAT